MLALALEPRIPKDFGAMLDAGSLPTLEVQEIGDDVADIRLAVFDSGVNV